MIKKLIDQKNVLSNPKIIFKKLLTLLEKKGLINKKDIEQLHKSSIIEKQRH